MPSNRARTSTAPKRFRPDMDGLERRELLNADVTTYQYNNSRTGANTQETVLSPSDVNATDFGRVSYIHVDGKVDAQPLYVANLVIPNHGTHNVLFVATENDSLYAFDADDAELLWQDGPSGTANNLLPAGETPVQAADLGQSNQVGTELGILDTPVIDEASQTLYVVAESRAVVNGAPQFHDRIHAINILTGADRVSPASIDSSITAPGANPIGNGSVVTFDPRQLKERDALTLSNGVVYTAWASNADYPPYTGWAIGFDASNLSLATIFNADPNGTPAATSNVGSSGASFWNSGGGFAIDANGYLYNVSANGPFDASASDYGDSILKFSTSGGLKVADYFAPHDQQSLADHDNGPGSSDVVLLPDLKDASGKTVQLAITAGKNGTIYVADRNNLGGFDATSDSQIHQELAGVLGSQEAGAGAYFNGQVYYGANGQPLRAFTITNSLLATSATSQTSINFAYPGTSPTISANGSTNGIVWALENNSVKATLHAYDASNLGRELYNSSQAANSRDQFGPDSKFIVPTVANGKVYVGTQSGIAVFGLLNPPQVVVAAHASAAPVVGEPFQLSGLGSDPVFPESSLTYTWAATQVPPGSPLPQAGLNRTNASKNISITVPYSGSYTFLLVVTAPDGLIATSYVTVQATLPTPSFATPPPTTATATVGIPLILSELGSDPVFAESSLIYSWASVSAPSGAAGPTFGSNKVNASKRVTVLFSSPGTYVLRSAVADPYGQVAHAEVSVVVRS